ncbi:MAG: hypothetical protein IT372_28035 [Polyangiaceae bacterium]|nr:hypothetical protein [Polyangiaceae bacterium]
MKRHVIIAALITGIVTLALFALRTRYETEKCTPGQLREVTCKDGRSARVGGLQMCRDDGKWDRCEPFAPAAEPPSVQPQPRPTLITHAPPRSRWRSTAPRCVPGRARVEVVVIGGRAQLEVLWPCALPSHAPPQLLQNL